ncbi:MAG TPA: tyrosine-type recombinase/integrase, partial [Flavisolibacter sp.]|nr:tyrosine-type recombinase/integrase [Flavisolibacter sp.]
LHPGHVLQRGAYTVVSMPRKKTQAKGGWIEVALNNEALQVIEKYKGQYERCLPVIVNQKMNVHLKTIGKLAGIDAPTNKIVFENGRAVNKIVPKYELITTHTARHTFATQSLMKNPPIPIEVLQRILGHSKIKDTLVYAKIVREFQHEIMMKTWN